MNATIWMVKALIALGRNFSRMRDRCLSGCGVLVAAGLISGATVAQAYTNDAMSREVSVFNDGIPSAQFEAFSREISIFNDGTNGTDTVSREVSVFNYGVNRMELTVGTTGVRAGDTGAVSIMLSTLVPITNVQMVVDFLPNLLTNWTNQPVLAGTLSVSNGNQLFLTFTPSNTQTYFTTQSLGQISFTAANQPTEILPLVVAGASGLQISGLDSPVKFFEDGQVVVIRTNSVLSGSVGTNSQRGLTLYGLPGTNYTIQSTTNLGPSAVWSNALSVTLSDFIFTTNLPHTNAAIFYRAKQ